MLDIQQDVLQIDWSDYSSYDPSDWFISAFLIDYTTCTSHDKMPNPLKPGDCKWTEDEAGKMVQNEGVPGSHVE